MERKHDNNSHHHLSCVGVPILVLLIFSSSVAEIDELGYDLENILRLYTVQKFLTSGCDSFQIGSLHCFLTILMRYL